MRFSGAHAEELRQAMCRARDYFKIAETKYQRALEIEEDTERNADGLAALRQEGRAYAEAVGAYYKAVMEWLAYTDVHKPGQ